MNDDLLADLLFAVDQQLHSPQTKYVKKTFDRLLKAGLEEAAAKRQIALCLGEAMDDVMRTKRPFDENSYRENLDSLPFADEVETDEESDPA